MKRILYIDPIGGLAGDMLCAALLDAGLHEETWRDGLNNLKWSEEAIISRQNVMRGVFAASHIDIKPPPKCHTKARLPLLFSWSRTPSFARTCTWPAFSHACRHDPFESWAPTHTVVATPSWFHGDTRTHNVLSSAKARSRDGHFRI